MTLLVIFGSPRRTICSSRCPSSSERRLAFTRSAMHQHQPTGNVCGQGTSSTSLALVPAASERCYRGHDSGGAGRRAGAVGGVRGGDVRAAGSLRSAEQGRHLPARVAAGRAAQVDAADGRAVGCGSSGAAAVRLLVDLGGGAGARAAGAPGDRGDRPAGLGGRRHRLPEGRHRLAGGARQDSGTLGKGGDCPVGVSISAVTDLASCPLNWRLFLPERWDDARAISPEAAAVARHRRERAGIPAEQRHREKWRLALDMLDELAGWALTPPGGVADAGYGDIAEFRDGLTSRGRAWVVQVQGVLSAHAEDAVPAPVPTSGRGRPSRPRYRTKPVALREHVLAAGRAAAVQLTWRNGSRGPMTSHFVALRVRPAGHHQRDRRAADGSLPAVWLLAEWPPEAAEPTDYWLAGLPADTDLAELVRLAKIRWRIEH